MREKIPTLAAIDDLRPGARIMLQYESADGNYEEEVIITTYPYLSRPDAPRREVALESARVECIAAHSSEIAVKGFFLSDYGLIEYAGGRSNSPQTAYLKQPAPADPSLQKSLQQSLEKPFNSLTTARQAKVSQYLASILDA